MKAYLLKKTHLCCYCLQFVDSSGNPNDSNGRWKGPQGNGMNQGGQRGSVMDSDDGRRGQGMRYEGWDGAGPGGGQGIGLGGNEGRGPGGGQGGGQRGHEGGRR